MKSFFKILKFILPYKFILVVATIFSILFSLSNGLTIYSVAPILDTLTNNEVKSYFTLSKNDKNFFYKKNFNLFEKAKLFQLKIKQRLNSYLESKTRKEILYSVSLLIIPLVFIRALFDFLARLLFSIAGNRAVLNIRKNLFSHLISLPFQYFHKSRSGELISRLTGDVIPVTNAVSTDLYNFISGLILFTTNIVILSMINWKMILFIIILVPVIAFPISFFGSVVKKYTKKLQEGFADISARLQETFSGIKVIKSFSMEWYENAKFNNINNIIFARDLKRRIFQNLNPSIVELLGAIAAGGIFIYGGYQIINGQITNGEFIFFMLLVLNLFEPVKNISNAINGTKAGEAAADRIFNIMELQEEKIYTGKEGTFNHDIEFKDVSFKYFDNFVLKNVNLHISKRKTTGIVGISGSGKTTILNMISSFYSPFQGKILIDNINREDLSINWIRKRIAVVTQDVFLFHGTILENLTCGKQYSTQKIEEAAAIAHAREFILKLPDGYDTVVGERGALLSGGERQRISIARALLADPDVILFDEATSSLDSESEKLIQDSLAHLFKNRTSIIVSHRLSTIQQADIIYLIHNGDILDKGNHSELLKRSDEYRRLFSY